MAETTAFERIVERLETVTGHMGRTTGGQMKTRCPAHEDRDPSLSVRAIEGQALVYCHGGCDTRDVLSALGLELADLYDDRLGATYRYASGRVVHRSPNKKFRQSGKRSTVELYRLRQLREAGPGAVWLVEGEKDVHAVESAGGVATTAPMGAANFAKVDVEPLRGRHVTAVVDRDEAGQKWAGEVARVLDGKVAGLRFVQAAEGKDAADHIVAGHGLDDFVEVEQVQAAEPEQTDEPARRLVLVPASSITPRRVEWLWTDRIPLGEVTLTPGRGGIGKSTYHAWVIAQVTRGALPGIHYGSPRACIIAAAEDSWARTIVPRLIAAGADLDLVFRVDVLTADSVTGRLVLPADCELLALQIKEYDVALVSLDPLMSVIHASIDTHRNSEVRTALEPLSRLADTTGAVFLGNAHFNKSGGTDPLSLITGSAAFGEVIRAALGFARDPEAEDGSFVLSQIKNNLGRLDLPSLRYVIENAMVDTADGPAGVGRFRLLGETDRSVADILSARGDGDGGDRSEREEAAAWLTGYLVDNGGEAEAPDVYKAAAKNGFSRDQLKRAKKKAGVRSAKEGFDSGWMWRLDHEGSAKGAKGVAHGEVHSSPPSVLPSRDSDTSSDKSPVSRQMSGASEVSGQEEELTELTQLSADGTPEHLSEDVSAHVSAEKPTCVRCRRRQLMHPDSVARGTCATCHGEAG